jgi:hypothetical protein
MFFMVVVSLYVAQEQSQLSNCVIVSKDSSATPQTLGAECFSVLIDFSQRRFML